MTEEVGMLRMRVENRGGMNQLEAVSSPRHQFPK